MASGCVYRINIQQGNFLNQAPSTPVKEGMTRSQVRYLAGHAHGGRQLQQGTLGLYYYLKKGRTRHVDSRRVTVYFDGDKVARLDKPTDAESRPHRNASAAKIKNGRIY